MAKLPRILLMSRGPRLHRFFLQMAKDLTGDCRVIVLATPGESAAFRAIPGVDVREYDTPDMLWDAPRPQADSAVSANGNVTAIERELGITLYKAASNYLLFSRLVKECGGRWGYLTTEAEIVAAYTGAYRQLRGIFDAEAPDLVFFESIDLISTYVAFALARQRGVFALELRFSPMGEGRITFGFGLQRRNIVLEYLYAHRQLIGGDAKRDAGEILGSLHQAVGQSAYATIHRRMLRNRTSWLRAAVAARRRPEWGRIASAVRDGRRHYRAAVNRRWLRRHATRTVPTGPYLVVPLQHIPEASICSQSPRWVRQESVVEQLAINAPGHLRIVVREHPRTIGSRGRAFFEPLLDLPNVVLCDPVVDMHALLRGAAAVVAVTGTPGFEALLLGKRVGVLGRPFYSIFPGVRQLQHPEDIYGALEDASWRPEAMAGERLDFLAAYLESLHEFGHGTGTDFFPPQGGVAAAAALRRIRAFIGQYGLTPAQFEPGL